MPPSIFFTTKYHVFRSTVSDREGGGGGGGRYERERERLEETQQDEEMKIVCDLNSQGRLIIKDQLFPVTTIKSLSSSFTIYCLLLSIIIIIIIIIVVLLWDKLS